MEITHQQCILNQYSRTSLCGHRLDLASFPDHLLLRSLDCIRDLWTDRRSARRPGITSTSSNCKVDSIMTYVDSVSFSKIWVNGYLTRGHVAIILWQHAHASNSHWLKSAQNDSATLPVYSYDTEDSTLDARWAVMRW